MEGRQTCAAAAAACARAWRLPNGDVCQWSSLPSAAPIDAAIYARGLPENVIWRNGLLATVDDGPERRGGLAATAICYNGDLSGAAA